MVNPEIRKQYTSTIGIECHVQLKTKTKLFAGVSNDARAAEPNTLISHICLGMPGALPVLNEEAIALAIKAAFALNVEPQTFSKFDRKHYFYPDLPKGYQITQFDEPIIVGGHVNIQTEDGSKRINITRAHLEEDAGKSTHPVGSAYSLVDLNRAGTPLLEIVSEPEIQSAQEAKAFAHELFLLMKYAGVSDTDLYHGNMRFDVNVSVSKNNTLGTRTETKNLNSFKSVERAVEYEIDRQIELIEKGRLVIQETRGWDDAKQKTFSQRSKEEAFDYRYFPEPDLPPVILQPEQIDTIRQGMPIMPDDLRDKLSGLKLDGSAIETLVNEMTAGDCMLNVLKTTESVENARKIASWLTSEVQSMVLGGLILWEEAILDKDKLFLLADMTSENKVSSTGAKTVLREMVSKGGDPIQIAERLNVLQVSDEYAVESIVDQVIAENQKAAADVRNGEEKAVGFLVGQVMKASKGKANPQLTQEILRKKLQ
jgi:aspartyl-tRNA(Asn)/glutamyl-tRNA(Gln) amidotransferase subunit B